MMLSRLVKSACIWYVYFPHLTMLRWVGPRVALLFTRGVAWIHWLLTLVGGHRTARRAITAALPALAPGLGVRTILRRYLAVKHQRFVEWYLYPTARGRRFVARTYRDVDGREHLDAALAEGKGVVLLVFHFGMAKMVFPALQALGYDNYHHVFRGATYADETFAPVAKAAMDALARTEEQSGLKVIYHRPNYTFATMVRLLRNDAIVGMNGDGMMGTEFVTLPFLGGTMPFPTGPARLAAKCGAPIISAYAWHEGLTRHRLVLHPPIRCAGESRDAIDAAVGQYVALLEDYVRRYPWAWWTWRRLDVAEAATGQTCFSARALVSDEGTYHAPQATAPAR
jgi:lauroyl/myristoyl acyltransferase